MLRLIIDVEIATEDHMADLKETESSQVPSEVPAKQQTPETEKKASKPKKTPRRQAGTARTRAASEPSAEAVASPAVRTTRKVYSEQERAQKLRDIENQTGLGSSLKDAVKKAGISEQTYYQWKKAAAQVPQGDELKDLVKLEEENARLKQLLADRLHKENAELRKKLGLG
jgi:putative transposase